MQLGEAVGQNPLHALPFRKRFAERLALLDVVQRHVETALGDAASMRAVAQPPFTDPALGNGKALPFVADPVFGGNAYILEDEFTRRIAHHGLMLGGDLDARRVHIDQKAGNAAAGAFAGSVTAITCAKSALSACVMKRLTPLMT